MSLELYVGALAVFEFDMDDLTTDDVDDFSTVTWNFIVLGADDEVIETAGTYIQPTVTVEISSEVSATVEPGIYLWYLIASQDAVDDIVAGDGTLVALEYPNDP